MGDSTRDDGPEPGLDRRRLLRLLVGGSGVAVVGMAGVPVASYLLPLEPSEEAAVAAFGDDEIGLWDAKQVIVAGRPVLVVNTGEGYRALSAVCTHLGCVVKWKKGRRQFFCPCDGARFDAIVGLARESAERFEVRTRSCARLP